MTKTILVGCAIAALMTGSAFAQGRGQGGGIGGGVGGGVGGGIGGGGGMGMGAGAGIGAGGMGMGAGASMGAGVRAEPPPIASGRSDTATSVRGAADVLPNTNASAQGVARGSASTTNATSANANANTGVGADASDRANDRRAATTDIRAGALVKNTSGATIGRIDSVAAASGSTAATVTVRSGNDTWTLPQSELSASGDFLVTSRTRPAQ